MAFHYPINGGGGGGGVTSLNGLTGAVTLSEGQNITLNESGSDIEINANFTQEGKYIISGGATWSGTGLTYDVSTLTYFFNGNKTASPTSITLDASDPTDNRFDAIVVDEAGVVTKITGTPSMNPEQPAIPSDQLAVQYILVEAASTEPTIASENIYLDDPTSGWTFSTYTTATPATGTINFAGTNSPKQGVNDIEASTDLRLGARFVRATSFDAFQYTMFQVWVRFTGTAVATNKSLNVRFENSAGTLVGNTINLFNYGLQRNVLNTWQLVVVPITAFGALPATVKGMKMIMAGGTVGQVRQWDVDYMILTNGSVPFANVPTIVFAKDSTIIASAPGINIKQGIGMTIISALNNTTGRVDYTFNATGSSPITIGTSGNTLYSSGLTGTGQGDTTAGYNIILGENAGNGATGVIASNFFGIGAGAGATGAYQSNFIGVFAGQNATNAAHSNFLGYYAGNNATGAYNSNFLGINAGNSATNASNSNFFGTYAGYGATSAYNSNFFGTYAGQNADNASLSNFLGKSAGSGATGAYQSNFLGESAGQNATNAAHSNFLGINAGNNATDASYSNFLGENAGNGATNASYSNFFGVYAGQGATDASSSNFFGQLAGQGATDASLSNFFGISAGAGAVTANNSIFIGNYSGNGDTVDNSTGGTSILIGDNTSTGGFSNSIAIGAGATNTASDQFIIADTYTFYAPKSFTSSISAVQFNGSGLDDMTTSGTYTGTQNTTYRVTIDANGTPDTFEWSKDNVTQATGVPITGSAQLLDDGVSVTFGATTGHTISDSWSFTGIQFQDAILTNNYDLSSLFGIDLQFNGEIINYDNKIFCNGILQNAQNQAEYSSLTAIDLINGISSEINVTLDSVRMSRLSATTDYVVLMEDIGLTMKGSVNQTGITIDDINQLITISNVPTYADDADATTNGLTTGQLYKTTTSGVTALNIVP